MVRDPRDYGLTADDRRRVLERKLGLAGAHDALQALARVADPTEPVLGAIVFLCRDGHGDDIDELVVLANGDRPRLLNAATVKDERG